MKKYLFDYFPEYEEEIIIKAVKYTSKKHQEILFKTFGRTLKENQNTNNFTLKEKHTLKNAINSINKIINNKDKTYLTNNIIRDTYNKIGYKPLTKAQEKRWIKKLKLAFYYDVDEETRNKYFKYYCEVKPRFEKKYNKANEEEKLELLKAAIEDAKREKEKFLLNNQRLIILNINNVKNIKISKEDLLQEANIGIITALQKFDVETNNKFSTYARWWIKSKITKYIEKNEETIRIPSNIYAKITKILKAEEEIRKNLYKEPTIEEIEAKTKIPIKEIMRLKQIIANEKNIISTDEILKNENDKSKTIEETLEDKNSIFTDSVEDKEIIIELQRIISKLEPKRQIIINMRMGLYDGKIYKLDYIAKKLNLPVERVKQLELSTLKTIKKEYELIQNNPKMKNKKATEKEELTNNILLEIEILDETAKQIIEMKYKYRLTNKEIAKILEISEKELIKQEKQAYITIKEKLKEKQKNVTYKI